MLIVTQLILNLGRGDPNGNQVDTNGYYSFSDVRYLEFRIFRGVRITIQNYRANFRRVSFNCKEKLQILFTMVVKMNQFSSMSYWFESQHYQVAFVRTMDIGEVSLKYSFYTMIGNNSKLLDFCVILRFEIFCLFVLAVGSRFAHFKCSITSKKIKLE